MQDFFIEAINGKIKDIEIIAAGVFVPGNRISMKRLLRRMEHHVFSVTLVRPNRYAAILNHKGTEEHQELLLKS